MNNIYYLKREDYGDGKTLKIEINLAQGYRKETWCLQGKLHREDGPAELIYIFDKLVHQSFYLKGKKHRSKGDGPAEIFYNPRDGSIRAERWYEKGKNILSNYNLR